MGRRPGSRFADGCTAINVQDVAERKPAAPKQKERPKGRSPVDFSHSIGRSIQTGGPGAIALGPSVQLRVSQ